MGRCCIFLVLGINRFIGAWRLHPKTKKARKGNVETGWEERKEWWIVMKRDSGRHSGALKTKKSSCNVETLTKERSCFHTVFLPFPERFIRELVQKEERFILCPEVVSSDLLSPC